MSKGEWYLVTAEFIRRLVFTSRDVRVPRRLEENEIEINFRDVSHTNNAQSRMVRTRVG